MDSATRACAASPLLLLARGGPLALNSAPPNSTPEEGDPLRPGRARPRLRARLRGVAAAVATLLVLVMLPSAAKRAARPETEGTLASPAGGVPTR
ncbi:hypothetical protein [Streptomyces sp. NBC_00063]|uniref:hypothetical protein n=1 Tax=Streptomyces sp. NBC_00063 TaxID=2975638 RepID=UPI003D7578F4